MQSESRPIRLSTQGKVITVAVIVALTVLLLQHVEHALPPFIAAIITAYLFNPLVGLLARRTKMARIWWILVLYVLAFTILYGLATSMWPRIAAQYYGLIDQVPNIIASVQQQFAQNQQITVGGLVIDLSPLEEQVISFIQDIGAQLPTAVPSLVVSALEAVVYLLVYLFVTFYLLLQTEQLMNWFYGLIPSPYRAEIRGLVGQIDEVLSAYIRGQLILIVIMSVLLYIPLSILGIRYALLIAIISGVLEIIPFIGPWSAAGIAMAAGVIQGHEPFGLSGIALAGVIGLTYLVLRLLEDNFIIPTVVGHFVKLHPVIVIFAILAGAAIGGAFGLFVAIPVAAVIRILLIYLYTKLVEPTAPTPVDIEPPSPAAVAVPPPIERSSPKEPTGTPAVGPQ